MLHVCGKGNLDASLENTPGYKQFEYLSDELPDAFACADIMLSRAGSNSLSELMALCKPALLNPYHSGRGDQVLNANSLKARGLAHVMPSELTAESLPPAIDALWAESRAAASAPRRPAGRRQRGSCSTRFTNT